MIYNIIIKQHFIFGMFFAFFIRSMAEFSSQITTLFINQYLKFLYTTVYI